MQIISHAKLPLSYPWQQMQTEVQQLQQQWLPHFNQLHYEGSWTALALRSPGGETGHVVPDAVGAETYANTPLMQELPSIEAWVEALPCTVMSVRLLNLAAGAVIKTHRDRELSFEQGEARLHLPIFTHPKVLFTIDGQAMHMPAGECWYLNANLPHSVVNESNIDRIHLVIDCVVNDWLQQTMANATRFMAAVDAAAIQQQQAVIAALREQGTATSIKLADDLAAALQVHLSASSSNAIS